MFKDDFNILLFVFSDLSLMNTGYVEQKINFCFLRGSMVYLRGVG